MLPVYVVLDLETTGGSGIHDRITEIAAVRVDHGQVTQRWSTLVNPETGIPPFIERLTGITDAMVENAPSFKEVSDELLEMLKDAVLVAHNASFDHGFLRGEYARLGMDLRLPSLCTVRLSRRLYPQFKSHGLDAIMQRHALHTDHRHRAMGDVDMVLQWLAMAQHELGLQALELAAQDLLQAPLGLPVQLETAVEELPDGPGIYIYLGDGPLPLWIGSTGHLRRTVTANFQTRAKSAQQRGIVANTRRIEWQLCAGELSAYLLSQELTGKLQPVYAKNTPPLAVNPLALHVWPFSGKIGIREHDAETERSAILIFDQWCHLGSAQNEEDLQELAARKPAPSPVDLGLYRLLVQRFKSSTVASGQILKLQG